MNIVVLAITLGGFPIEIVENHSVLIDEIKTIFPEGNVTPTTTGDDIRHAFKALHDSRQGEILAEKLVCVRSNDLAKAVYKAIYNQRDAEKNLAWFLVLVATVGFMISSLIVVYLFDEAAPLTKGAIVTDRRDVKDDEKKLKSDPLED